MHTAECNVQTSSLLSFYQTNSNHLFSSITRVAPGTDTGDMAPSLVEQVSVDKLGPNEFVSKALPIHMGNASPMAYGGCALAIAMSAAYATVPDSLVPYSMMGHFLGPASTDRKLYASVTQTRNARSFATRRVEIKQKLDNGNFRNCLEAMIDFQIREPSLFEYSAPTWDRWPKPDDCPTLMSHAESLRARGLATQQEADHFSKTFSANAELFESRYCTNGVSGQNLGGVAKHAPTMQDNLPITSRTSAEWQRALCELKTPAENFAALAFLMDAALSFLPLTFMNMFLDDVGACASLDFALRMFTGDLRLQDWLLKERSTSRGGEGRTYSEGRVFDERGQMVASMTQQSIMRAKPEPKKSKI